MISNYSCDSGGRIHLAFVEAENFELQLILLTSNSAAVTQSDRFYQNI